MIQDDDYWFLRIWESSNNNFDRAIEERCAAFPASSGKLDPVIVSILNYLVAPIWMSSIEMTCVGCFSLFLRSFARVAIKNLFVNAPTCTHFHWAVLER